MGKMPTIITPPKEFWFANQVYKVTSCGLDEEDRAYATVSPSSPALERRLVEHIQKNKGLPVRLVQNWLKCFPDDAEAAATWVRNQSGNQ